jgi:hypothetical protein
MPSGAGCGRPATSVVGARSGIGIDLRKFEELVKRGSVRGSSFKN